MKKIASSILFFIMSFSLFSQGKFERKIIVEDSIFYAIEIVDQVGVLWMGNIFEPLDSAQQYALPAGTKRRSLNFLPLAWDLKNDTVYVINFTEYAQNERLSSLKSIPLSSLAKYDPLKGNAKLLWSAAFENSMIENWPLVKTLKKYKYIDDLFFDMIVGDSVIYQFITVNNELTVWDWENDNWHQSEIIPFEAQQFYTIYFNKNDIYLVNTNGEKYLYNNKLNAITSKPFELGEKIMVDNRDYGSITFINNALMANTRLTFMEIIGKYLIGY